MSVGEWPTIWVTSVGRFLGYHPEEFRLATLEPDAVPDAVWEDVAQEWMTGWTVVGLIALVPNVIGFLLTIIFKIDALYQAGYFLGFMLMALGWSASVLTWCRRTFWRRQRGAHPPLFRRRDLLLQLIAVIITAWSVVALT